MSGNATNSPPSVTWGPWSLAEVAEVDGPDDGLSLMTGRYLFYAAPSQHRPEHILRYAIRLDDIRHAGDILNWLCHMARKSWVTPEALGHLVRAFKDTISLEATLRKTLEGDNWPRVAPQ
jgi:hypothetical protein